MTLVRNATSSSDIYLQSDCIHNESSNWSALYGSSIWNNSRLRGDMINDINKYCNTCGGKIRNYNITPARRTFLPPDHSTPKVDLINATGRETRNQFEDSNNALNYIQRKSTGDVGSNNKITHISTISQQVDGGFSKYRSADYNIQPKNISQRRLTKSLKGIGCIVNFSLTDSPKKRRAKIQACSIGLMIVAILVISLILVNFTTPSLLHLTNVTSTSSVPIDNIYFNETTSAVVSIPPEVMFTIEHDNTYQTTTERTLYYSTKSIVSIISKIRKNIKTYPKKSQESKELVNRDLSSDFCSCQINEVCLLDETSGTSICKVALDKDDPTGCGGLCALDTEACQLVDKSRGVRICKLLTQIKCLSHDWRCRDGFCVPSEARCDGFIQCYDRSDEMHCECDLKKQFRCGNSISCFSNKKKCDGFIDCWDGFDEVNCTLECPTDQFTCNDGQCIISSRFCDGLADCADGSDEPQGCGGACGTHEVQCQNHRCVSRSTLCNGQNDCGDNSDEMHCS